MNIQYVNPGFVPMMESILRFQTEGETPYWSEPLFSFFPALDRTLFSALSGAEQKAYLTRQLELVYNENEGLLNQKAEAYNRYWKECRPQVEAAFSDAFALDAHLLFYDLQGEISLNPISPRFLAEKRFEVFYLNSERGAIGVSLHEMVHFLWFAVWNREFQDGVEDYERPHLKWILSEMVVECILRDDRLRSINPYFPREHGGCVYGYFQDMVLKGEPALEHMDTLYRQMDIVSFMHESYRYCLDNEAAIRGHIARAETENLA